MNHGSKTSQILAAVPASIQTDASAGPSSSAAPPPNLPPSNSNLEFSETSAVTLTWNLSGLSQMYTSSVGEAKSYVLRIYHSCSLAPSCGREADESRKCIKSAIFGDADNLWEVLWYPNSGVQGGEYASLYLSCVVSTLLVYFFLPLTFYHPLLNSRTCD